MIALVISVLAVAEVITVRFVGRDADKNRYVKLDSVAVANLTKNWTQTVVYPDTVMELEPQSTAIQEVAVSKFGIAELSPNPAEGVAYFNLAVPKSGKVVLTLTDLNGRSLLTQEEEMPVGVYAFRLTMPEATSFVVRATNGSEISVAKVINLKPAAETSLTQIARISDVKRIMQKAVQIGTNDYEKDDEMQYIGFVSVGDSTYTSDTITQVQTADEEEIELIFHLCEPIETEFLATECDEYIWNEIKLSESGKYDQTFTAANGCDSIVTLNLTVNKSVKNEITEIACDSLKWNDQTYTASGDYTQIFTAANGCDSIVTFHYRRGFIDKRDSTFYKIVKIGDQLWMQENLRYLPQVDNTSNMANPSYYVYGYTGTDVAKAKATENYKTYGTLYNWHAAKAAAPAGWKLPTNAEWTTLKNAVGSTAAAKLAGRADLWTAGNLTNSADFGTSGFEGLPAGMIMTSNIAPGGSTRWWTATTASSTQSIYFIIYYSYTLLDLDKADNTHGYSVRCLYVGPTE